MRKRTGRKRAAEQQTLALCSRRWEVQVQVRLRTLVQVQVQVRTLRLCLCLCLRLRILRLHTLVNWFQ